jgi:hypothetical protein
MSVYVGGLRQLETAVMDQVWAHDRPVTAGEVAAVLRRALEASRGQQGSRTPDDVLTADARRSSPQDLAELGGAADDLDTVARWPVHPSPG